MRLNRYARISIIHSGLDDIAHPNIETWRALFRAKLVFHMGRADDAADWLAGLANVIEVVDLGLGFERMGPHRPNLFRAMATRVVAAAQMQGEIVLIEPGPALVVDLVTPFVLQAAEKVSVPVRTIPASRQHEIAAAWVRRRDPESP